MGWRSGPGIGQAAPAGVRGRGLARERHAARLRALAVSAAIGAGIGAAVGGTLARVAMRLVLVADSDTRGFETAAGATVGDVTAAGTAIVFLAALLAGTAVGAAYWLTRPFLPEGGVWRIGIATLAATLLGTAFVVSDGRADFAFVPEAVSVVLIAVAFALTALAVVVAVDRLTRPRRRASARVSVPVVAAVLVALAALAAVRVAAALDVLRVV